MNIPRREPYYRLNGEDHLPNYVYHIENPYEILKNIDTKLYKKQYNKTQLELIKYAILILTNEYKDEDLIKIVNSLSINFYPNLKGTETGNTVYKVDFNNEKMVKYPTEINIRTLKRPLIYCQATLLHELRHVLTSLHNVSYRIDKNYFYVRRGLFICKTNKKQRGVGVGHILDEIYNVHFTNYNMTNLLSLKRKMINNYLLKLKNPQPSGLYRGASYDSLVNILYPLLVCNELTYIAGKSSYDGHVENYYNAFNNLFGDIIKCTEFMQSLDEQKFSYDNQQLIDKLYTTYQKRI